MDEQVLVLLMSIFTSLAGILLTWKNYRLHARATGFDDLVDLIEVYREEIARRVDDGERQEQKLITCNERLLEARHRAAVCEERLRIERELFDRQLHQKQEGEQYV